MAGTRIPLCLLYDDDLKGWRAFQTENQVRGQHHMAACIWLRTPTNMEKGSVEAALYDTSKQWTFTPGVPYVTDPSVRSVGSQ